MTDPITCPECEGAGGTRLGRLRLACQFCGGRGVVGGEYEPAEPPPPPTEQPPAWEHRVWSDPAVTAVLACRYCLDSGQVAHIDEMARTLVTVPCTCRTM